MSSAPLPEPAQPTQIGLAVALDGTGWHPASWRGERSEADRIFSGRYWGSLAAAAEGALLDFVTIEDALGVQTDSPLSFEPSVDPTRLRGRLDASLIASWLGARTSSIGIVPTLTTTHTEPFHVSNNLATLDHVSSGRAGWRAQVSARPAEARHFGRRPELSGREINPADVQTSVGDLFDEAADVIEAVRRLWDSWEDDAEIRDVASGRFIDRDKLHYIDFASSRFSVKGPSITPRSPQGQPVVTVLGHQQIPYELAATSADLLYVTPHDDGADAQRPAAILETVRRTEVEQQRGDRGFSPLQVYADLEVVLEADGRSGEQRLAELNDRAGVEFTSDALIHAGSVDDLVDRLRAWHELGYAGFRLRPAEHAVDLPVIADAVVPALQSAGLFRTGYEESTLRERLGLPTAVNRYAAASA